MEIVVYGWLIFFIFIQDQKYEDYWINLEGQFKSDMKEAILATLASPSSLVRRQIAQVLSAIASIEIPRREWDELIPSLSANSLNEDMSIRLTSLTTIGYLCEEIKADDISQELKNEIVKSMVQNISTDAALLEPTKLAVRAMPNAIEFASKSFEND